MRIYILICLFIISGTSIAQKREWMPEDTEVWKPVPKIITPGENKGAPSDAIILFDGTDLSEWVVEEISNWEVNNGILTIKPTQEKIERPDFMRTKRSFGDMQLHIEWRAPEKVSGDGQRRGNSGIFIQEKYELQIQDNYNNPTYVNGQAGAIYKQIPPMVNACRKPGEWQVYDVFYTAPKFDDIGLLLVPAYITVVHNGILIQNHAEIKGSIKFIGLPHYEPHGAAPLGLQDHGNAVSYRNIWVREL